MGLFCQAMTGVDGLHGTDMETKNQKKKAENGTFGIGALRGVREVVICPLFDEKNMQKIFATNGQNQGP